MNYNVFNVLCQGLSAHNGWTQAWRSPEPKSHYDAMIIGGGGHGLATAYYLAHEHGMRNIAVLEKGWLGGGNTGHNTTNVRSDYMFPESSAMYNFALQLYETLGKDLNYNIMLSQRGWLTLIHDQHQLEGARHKANWLQCNGVDGEIISADSHPTVRPFWARRRSRTCTSTADGARVVSRPSRRAATCSPTPSLQALPMTWQCPSG